MSATLPHGELTMDELRAFWARVLEPTALVGLTAFVLLSFAVLFGIIGSNIDDLKTAGVLLGGVLGGGFGVSLVQYWRQRSNQRHETHMAHLGQKRETIDLVVGILKPELERLRSDIKGNAEHIAELRQQNRAQETEIKDLRESRHDLREDLGASVLLSDLAGRELDKVLTEQGKPPMYAEIRKAIEETRRRREESKQRRKAITESEPK